MIDLKKKYATATPVWLITVTTPQANIRFTYPSPLSGVLDITETIGGTANILSFYAGIGQLPEVQFDLSLVAPQTNLSFYLPSVYNLKPVQIEWANARVEMSHWFPGTGYTDRVLLMTGELANTTRGALDELIQSSVIISNVIDYGLILDPNTLIDEVTWPDTRDEFSGSNQDTLEARRRAHLSTGKYPGDIIGYPFYAEAIPVTNEVEGNETTNVNMQFAKAVLCNDNLFDITTDRIIKILYAEDYRNQSRELSLGIADSGLQSAVDGYGNYTICVSNNEQFSPATFAYWNLTALTTLGYDSTFTENAAVFYGANDTFNPCRSVKPGDYIGLSTNTIQDLGLVISVESGPVDVGGVGTGGTPVIVSCGISSNLPTITADTYDTSPYIIRTLSERGTMYVDCQTLGGRKNSGGTGVLSLAGDVITEYLSRSSGVLFDWERIQLVTEKLNGYRIDGHIREQMSPLEWMRRDLFTLLPVAEALGPKGWYLHYLDPTSTNSVCDLILGKNEVDGRRISMLQDYDDNVINYIQLKYGWRPDSNVFDLVQRSARQDYNPTYTNAAFTVYSLPAIESQKKYGLRQQLMETKWTWDTLTAQKIISQILARKSQVHQHVTYELNKRYNWLLVGDIVRVTDEDFAWQDKFMRVRSIKKNVNNPIVTLETY